MSLAVRDLTVKYDATSVLVGIDLSVETGERFAIMGPSGSGKSTLLRAIAGLIDIDSGTIAIDDTDVAKTPAHRRSVGLMFQDYALFPHMTVAQNVGYGLRMSGVAKQQRTARSLELLELVGLGGFQDREPTTLSGGEQQRVALARTLAPSPSIVLLDEPLASLDVSLRVSLLAETRSILDEVGATSIYVTHDKAEAFAFCDRMAILDTGRLVRIGTPDEIWRNPRSEFVARSVGQMNLIPIGWIDRSRSGLCFVPFDAITVQSDGRFAGTVVTSRFTDGEYVTRLRLLDEETTMEVRTHQTLQPGTELRFDVEADAVIVVSTDQL
ncbi:MAG: ABC transporter ATP-binding protein [Acidimicrobiia bacterium]|nr:MAG: ABC transporter ATP-binding protein [Acidimicrobiia bacterium]